MPVSEERERKAVEHAKTVLSHYEKLGPVGNWGKVMIQGDLDRYERAKEKGFDVEALVVELEGIE